MAAPQPLHIFRKDLTHLWPETLVTLLLFAAFAWVAPYGWQATQYSPYISILGVLLHILMPISWLIVISRLIHDESLVGDRQFWTSRPYHWASLFVAKLLYLAVFLYLPFLLMQVYLLKHAGLYPTTAMSGLAHNLLLLTVLLVVPITALAAVTSTFPRLLLSTIGAIVYVVIIALIAGYFLIRHMLPPHLFGLIETLVIALPLAALLYQYATRKTTISRGILLATPLVTALVLFLTPAGALIHSAYPLATGSQAPVLAPIPRPAETPAPIGQPFNRSGDVLLNLPFTVSGVQKDSAYDIDGLDATVTGSGTTWHSGYLPALGTRLSGGSPYTVLRVLMPLAVFNKVRQVPSDVHVSLAAQELKTDAAPAIWHSTLLPFSVPGHGVCRYPAATEDDPDAAAGSPTCRFPFAPPEVLFVSAPVTPLSCTQPAGPPQPGRQVLTQGPNTLDFDPVALVPLRLQTGDPEPRHAYQLCPGTDLSFLEARPTGKSRIELDAKQLTLDFYALRQTVRPPTVPTPQ